MPDVPDDDLLLFTAEIMGHYALPQFLFFAIVNVDAKWQKRGFIIDHLEAERKTNADSTFLNFMQQVTQNVLNWLRFWRPNLCRQVVQVHAWSGYEHAAAIDSFFYVKHWRFPIPVLALGCYLERMGWKTHMFNFTQLRFKMRNKPMLSNHLATAFWGSICGSWTSNNAIVSARNAPPLWYICTNWRYKRLHKTLLKETAISICHGVWLTASHTLHDPKSTWRKIP